MAKLVTKPDIVEFLEFIYNQHGNKVRLQEISCSDLDSCYLNKSIKELNIRSACGANIIGIKNEDGIYIYNPSPNYMLTSKHKIFMLGTPEQMSNMKELLV